MYEDMMSLFEKYAGGFELFLAFEKLVCGRFPAAQLRIKHTQAGFFDGCGFAWASAPMRGKAGATITLGLPCHLDSPRVFAATEPYPGRWTHHFILHSADELDDEFIIWLDEAHSFALARSKK